MQLPECLDTIGEELHTLLTEDYIEDTTFEWLAHAPYRAACALSLGSTSAAGECAIM